MTCNETLTWIDAFVDNELELSRQLDVEQHLKGCAACAQKLQARRTLQTAMRDPALRFELPAGLEHDLRDRVRHAGSEAVRAPAGANWRGWWGGFVSAAALTSVLFRVSPYLALPVRDNRLAQEVTNSHVHSLMAHHLIDVESSNQHTVKPWFNGRIDFAPEVRDLSGEGFRLAGGRLDYIGRRPVAALVYYRALHPINLYIWPADARGARALKSFTRQGYHLQRWSKDGMNYWAVSDLNEHDLTDFTEFLQR